MKVVLKIVRSIIISVWVLFAIISTILLISFNEYSVSEIGKYSFVIVDSDRLEPDFKENDLVIVKRTSESKYKQGEKAFFYLSNPADYVFINYGKINRIEELDHAEDSYHFDDNVIVPYSKMIGSANGVAVYHGWGLILSIFESRWGFMFLVIFPTIFAIVFEIYSIIEEAKRDTDEE